MTEGLARHLLGERFHVQSAGSKPSVVNPLAILVMKEIGIDISTHHSKSVSEIDHDNIDWVITLCAEEVCPVFLGKAKRLHWPLPDPAIVVGSESERLRSFRMVRELIREKLKTLSGIK